MKLWWKYQANPLVNTKTKCRDTLFLERFNFRDFAHAQERGKKIHSAFFCLLACIVLHETVLPWDFSLDTEDPCGHVSNEYWSIGPWKRLVAQPGKGKQMPEKSSN